MTFYLIFLYANVLLNYIRLASDIKYETFFLIFNFFSYQNITYRKYITIIFYFLNSDRNLGKRRTERNFF